MKKYTILLTISVLIFQFCKEPGLKSNAEYTIANLEKFALENGLKKEDFDIKILNPTLADKMSQNDYEQLQQIILEKSKDKIKLEKLNKRHEELNTKMREADKLKDTAMFNRLLKEYSDIITSK